MNLTDIQVELRLIENHISVLHSEIEKMKPRTDEEKKEDFDAITKLAVKHPISNSTMASAPTEAKKLFVGSLAYMFLSSENEIYSRLLYLCRFAKGCGLELSAEDIYRTGLDFELKDMDRLCENLIEYKYTYLTEAFIIANLSKEAPVNMLTLISDISKIMGCDKEEIRVIAQVAKSRLLDNVDLIKEIPVPSENRWSNKFPEYIPHEWIISQRIKCGEVCTEKYEDLISYLITSSFRTWDLDGDGARIHKQHLIKSRLLTQSVVKKGDCILTYEEQAMEKSEKTIEAPCDGIVYYIENEKEGKVTDKKDKYLVVYVVSYFDEYEDFYNWFSEGK